MAAITINNVDNAVRSLGLAGEEAAAVRRLWASGFAGRSMVEDAVRSRFLRIMLEGPAGVGKNRALRSLAASLEGGLYLLDLDGDSANIESDRYRQVPLRIPPTRLEEGEAKGRMQAAAQSAYDHVWAEYHRIMTGISDEVRAGRSSGVAIDSVTALVNALISNGLAAQPDLGADADDREQMASNKARSRVFSAAVAAARQIYSVAEEGVWTAPPGPVVGVTLAHAKPKLADMKDGGGFLGWRLALGEQTANEIRQLPDFIFCVGMAGSDAPGSQRLRYYAEIDENKAGGAKARWSQTLDRKDDPAERDPALAFAKALDLAGFVKCVYTFRSTRKIKRLMEAAAKIPQ